MFRKHFLSRFILPLSANLFRQNVSKKGSISNTFSGKSVRSGDFNKFSDFTNLFNIFLNNQAELQRFGVPRSHRLKPNKIYEDGQFELRAETSNLFNFRKFGIPDLMTGDAFILFTAVTRFVGSFPNFDFNNRGSRTMRFRVRFLF
jgi:hypothetical protein